MGYIVNMKPKQLLACFLMVVAIISLQGCGIAARKQLAADITGKKVAIVSILGDSAAVQTTGTTVFSNWKKQFRVPEWQIDEYVESTVLGELKKANTVRGVVPDSTQLKQIAYSEKKFWVSIQSLLFGRSEKNIKLIQQFGEKVSADYVLVIGSHYNSPDPFYGTNQSLAGYGIYQREFFDSKIALNYTLLSALLIKTDTGDVAWSVGEDVGQPRNKGDWLSENGTLSNTEKEKLRDSIYTQINESVFEILYRLYLIQ